MIKREQINDLIAELKSHTMSSLRAYQKDILPYIITCKDKFPTADMTWEEKYSRIAPVRKYHYKDKWYCYRYSDDYPEETIGILRVEDLVIKNFARKTEKDSFISSIEALMWQHYIQPFLLFINNKVINWNDIDLVFDANECFLLLHGEQYNYLYIEECDFKIVTLPFSVSYVGTERDEIFSTYYAAFVDYICQSVSVRDGKIFINVPELNCTHRYHGCLYPIGAWYYRQIKMEFLGKLSDDRIKKLKNVSVYNTVDDEVTKKPVTVYNRFNALDKDSYERSIYEYICYNMLEEDLVFGFNEDGLFDLDGNNRWYLKTDKIYHEHFSSTDEYIYHRNDDVKNVLQRENYLVFSNGLLDIDRDIVLGLNNLIRIKNTSRDSVDVITFYHKDLTPVWRTPYFKFNKNYLDAKAREFFDIEKKVYDGIQAILMDDDGNLTDTIIYRVDAMLQDLYIRNGVLMNPKDENLQILALLMDSANEFTGEIWNKIKVVNSLYHDNAELLDSEYRKIYAELIEENERIDGMVLSESFMLIDVADDKYLEMLHGLLAICNDGRVIPLDGKLSKPSSLDLYTDNLAMLNSDYRSILAYIMDNAGEYTGEVIPLYDSEYMLIKHDEYPIQFVNHHDDIMAMTMNDDGTFTGRIIHNVLNYDNVVDDYTMLLNGVIFINYQDAEINDYITECMKYLNYEFSDVLPYEDNVDNAIQSIIDYDVSIFNRLNHTTIHTITMTADEVNANLYDPDVNGIHSAINITRDIIDRHESFCLVFLNGELISTYSHMINKTNYLILPIDQELGYTDTLEIMWFFYIDNNEIHFKMTQGIRNNLIRVNEAGENVLSLYGNVLLNKTMRIFEKYPENIMHYSSVIEKSNDIAFNVSYKNDNDEICVMDVLDNMDDEFIAVSTRKFVYERLYPRDKSYRLRMGRRFRYCDNIKQYMLFINGRRINEDSYFVTIPKYSRPFDSIWLYVAKFVKPEDRVEIFYLPEEMYNDNTDNSIALSADGYIEVDKTKLDVPLDNRLYAFFINGKKIPANDIETINSYILRMKKDTKTLMPLVVKKLYKDTMSEVEDYMHDPDRLCIYDNLIENIRHSIYLGKKELNNLFNIYTTISDLESNKLSTNVGRIAIINEVVRDFWLRSGFNYNEPGFTYDYDIDEIIEYDADGNIALPAMDSTIEDNVIKNETHLLYFYPSNDEYLIEKGSFLENIRFVWDYALSTIHDPDTPLKIIHQDINGVEVDPDERYYDWTFGVNDTSEFLFTGNTGYQLLQLRYILKFVLPVFYGNIPKDSLDNFRLSNIISLEDIIALIPKRGYLPNSEEMELQQQRYNIMDDLVKDYYIWRNIGLVNKANIIDYELITDLIAIIPNEYEELHDMWLWKDLAERGMQYTLERYRYMTFDGLLLVDPNEDPIEWLRWLKAIIPADGDVMDYPERLIPPNGTVLLDDRIDSIFALLLREDGKLTNKRWTHLFSINEDDQDWKFFEWLNPDMDNIGVLNSTMEKAYIPEGIEPLLDIPVDSPDQSPNPFAVLGARRSSDLICDLDFKDSSKIAIGDLSFFTIADWDYFNFITKDLLAFLLNEDGTISDRYFSDIGYKPRQMDKIYSIGYKKDRWGLPRTKFLDEEGMMALFMDDDGNFTGTKVNLDLNSEYVYDDVYAEDLEVETLHFDEEGDVDSVEVNNPSYHVNLSDSTLNIINPDGSVTINGDTFDGLIAYVYDKDGNFMHQIYDDPYNAIGYVIDEAGIVTDEQISMKDILIMIIDDNNQVTKIVYLNDDSIFALTMAEDGSFNIDKTKIEEPLVTISLNSNDYNVYALAMTKSLKVREDAVTQIIDMGNMSKVGDLTIDDSIMALLMDDSGNFTGTTIEDVFGPGTHKDDLIVDLDDAYILTDNDDRIGLYFIDDLDTIVSSRRKINTTIDEAISNYIDATEDFIYIDTSIDNMYLLHQNDKDLYDISEEDKSYLSPEDITAVYKNVNDEYIFVDNDKIPFGWLKDFYAITDMGDIVNLAESSPNEFDDVYSRILAIFDDGREVEINLMDDTTLVHNEPSQVDLYEYLTGENVVFIDDLIPEDMLVFDPYTEYHQYNSESDLNHLMVHLEKHLQESAEMDIRYPMGNKNYWICAIPERYAYNYNGSRKFDFFMQDLDDPDLLDHANNKYTMPLYCDSINGKVQKIDKMEMQYLGETEYTNEYGVSSRYVLYKTNGYFNRLYDEYGISIRVKNRAS